MTKQRMTRAEEEAKAQIWGPRLDTGGLRGDEPFIIDSMDGSTLGVQRALREGKLTYRQAKAIWPKVKNV